MDSKHHTLTSKPKSKNKLLQMLPKAMSFGHRVPPFSPGRDLHHNHHSSAASNKMFFSGPMVPLVSNAARVRRNKNDSVWDEPTSPKVSCIGQIKLGKSSNKCPTGKKKKAAASLIPKVSKTSSSLTKEDDKGHVSKIKRFFSFSSANTASRKSHPTAISAADEHPVTMVSAAAAVPSLGQMKKFASSREGLGGFDWAAEMKLGEDSPADHHRGYYSDDDTRGANLRGDDDDDDEDDIIIPFSAPLGLNLRPKKEVNLWKRRTMDPPKPLHLQTT
ncbi:PREDICTED: uncharacterized protein At1g76070-like [Camelina sativa]|uniref:Uncharacterized protein At1g76070-like n=1 Tax=Camelina sativa TaxID=90675 RepID=A0ABM0WJ02_CAMSA|nr:PREDICTED: uncharacterized protein At1g76070-like [Camelina sativa]